MGRVSSEAPCPFLRPCVMQVSETLISTQPVHVNVTLLLLHHSSFLDLWLGLRCYYRNPTHLNIVLLGCLRVEGRSNFLHHKLHPHLCHSRSSDQRSLKNIHLTFMCVFASCERITLTAHFSINACVEIRLCQVSPYLMSTMLWPRSRAKFRLLYMSWWG